ncbi:MAG TPA: hypothetical protein VF760_00600 [Xanthobacteraceae bacterium]
MDAKVKSVIDVIEALVAPDKISLQEAYDFISEVQEALDERLEMLRDELQRTRVTKAED